MKENFDRILNHILEFEGGYVNDPDDPGGETKYGISKRSFPKEDIKNLTVDRAKELYRTLYWTPINGDELPDKMDLCVMNAAVNSGVGTALKFLKSIKDNDPDTYLFIQEEYYLAICKKHPTLKKYLYNWFYRTCQVRRIIWGM